MAYCVIDAAIVAATPSERKCGVVHATRIIEERGDRAHTSEPKGIGLLFWL